CGAYGNDAPASLSGSLSFAQCVSGYADAFRMHDVVFDGTTHRLESACAYMQRDESLLYTQVTDLLHQFVAEMQPSRRGGNSARFAGIDGLIALVVLLLGGMLYIRRQWRGAVAFQQVQHRLREGQQKEFAFAA